MKSYIIGIAGEKGSGKDTLASMINYIFAKGTTQAKYTDFITSKVKFELSHNDRIIHFADPMKDCLSIMFNIERSLFDDRVAKDVLWYSLYEQRFITEQDCSSDKYAKIFIQDLEYYSLDYYIKFFGKSATIKLRTLMQYFGTEIGRKHLGDNLWVNATMGRAANIAQARRVCIIPDMRFNNEHKAVKFNYLYGGDIYIHRNESDQDRHSSEIIDFTCKYEVDNNHTKSALFYKAITIVRDILANN